MAQEVPQNVKKCLTILKLAKSDTQKVAALYMVPKLMKGSSNNSYCIKLIFNTIGFPFLKKLLLCADVPAECTPLEYKLLAVSILSFFCTEPEIAADPQILSNVTIFLDIVENADDSEDNVIVIGGTYECLACIARCELGANALFDVGAVPRLCHICFKRIRQMDQILDVLVILVEHIGPDAWRTDINLFNALMGVLSFHFQSDHSVRKFKLCSILHSFLCNSPKVLLENGSDDKSWPVVILKGVNDILSSKIVNNQRDPALALASQMMITMGAEWMVKENKQFFLLLIQLTSVEVRMQLEDRTLDQIMKNASLVTACFSILELCTSFIVSHSSALEDREIQLLFRAINEAFYTVVSVLDILSNRKSFSVNEKLLIYAMIRIYSGWLTQEHYTPREKDYDLMPFILILASESFYLYRSKYDTERIKKQSSRIEIVDDNLLGDANLFCIFLPALCKMVLKDDGRQMFIKHCKVDVLYDGFTFYWSIRENSLSRSGQNYLPTVLNEERDSRSAMANICSIFIDVVVSERQLATENELFISLAAFVFNNLPKIKYVNENVEFYGSMVVLGLSLLDCQRNRIEKDESLCRYVECAILFLRNAFYVQETVDGPLFALSTAYKKCWGHIGDLWYSAMLVFSSILGSIPWIPELVVNSGWVQETLGMLKQVKTDSVPAVFKQLFETLFYHLIWVHPAFGNALKNPDTLAIFRKHEFTQVGQLLFGTRCQSVDETKD